MSTRRTKTAAITGAGSGIGRATALHLAGRGWHLALSDIHSEGLEETARLARDLGSSAQVHLLDVRDPEALQGWATALEDGAGGADLLVNNAGVTVYGTLGSMSRDDVDWVIDVNLRGVVHGCRAFAPQLAARRGHIVNIASSAGLLGMPMQTTYSASKFAVRGFSAALRSELAALGVGVTAILPGVMATPLLTRARSQHTATLSQMAEWMERFGASPDRVARAVERAVRRNRAEIVVGLDAHLVAWLQRLAPWLARWTMGVLFGRLASSDGLPHPEDRENSA